MAYLTLDRQREIDDIITNMTMKYDDDSCFFPPADVQKIAESRGIEVFDSDLARISGRPSGMITYDNPDKRQGAKAYLERSMSLERKRFTLAHEIGHHVMHKGEKLRLDNLDYSTENTLDESEANYFAASLLMPRRQLTTLIKAGKKDHELAEFFQVSVSALRNRIQWILNN